MKEVLVTVWHFLQVIGTVSIIFAIFTLIIHIHDSRLLKQWKRESEDAHKAQMDALVSIEEGNKYIAGVAERVAEHTRYIADLVVKEGQLTREAINR